MCAVWKILTICVSILYMSWKGSYLYLYLSSFSFSFIFIFIFLLVFLFLKHYFVTTVVSYHSVSVSGVDSYTLPILISSTSRPLTAGSDWLVKAGDGGNVDWPLTTWWWLTLIWPSLTTLPFDHALGNHHYSPGYLFDGDIVPTACSPTAGIPLSTHSSAIYSSRLVFVTLYLVMTILYFVWWHDFRYHLFGYRPITSSAFILSDPSFDLLHWPGPDSFPPSLYLDSLVFICHWRGSRWKYTVTFTFDPLIVWPYSPTVTFPCGVVWKAEGWPLGPHLTCGDDIPSFLRLYLPSPPTSPYTYFPTFIYLIQISTDWRPR